MARRMSNRERIEHLRAEADATAREKAAAKAARAAAGPTAKNKKAPPAARRVRIVWSVCDASGREVQQFPYAQEQEARAEAQRRTEASGRTHFVTQADVPAP